MSLQSHPARTVPSQFPLTVRFLGDVLGFILQPCYCNIHLCCCNFNFQEFFFLFVESCYHFMDTVAYL